MEKRLSSQDYQDSPEIGKNYERGKGTGKAHEQE